jgi:hypothetical protein
MKVYNVKIEEPIFFRNYMINTDIICAESIARRKPIKQYPSVRRHPITKEASKKIIEQLESCYFSQPDTITFNPFRQTLHYFCAGHLIGIFIETYCGMNIFLNYKYWQWIMTRVELPIRCSWHWDRGQDIIFLMQLETPIFMCRPLGGCYQNGAMTKGGEDKH